MPPADPANPRLRRECYFLTVRQNPLVGKAVGSKPQDRKPIDPPPIVRLQIKDLNDPAQNYLQSPYFMCVGTLWEAYDDHAAKVSENNQPPLAGTLVSSLHKLKDTNNEDAGFFVFGDMSVRPEGEFRIRFVLYELLQGEVVFLQSVLTQPFNVYPAKSFPGLQESSFLSRAFGDQGVRLRIRKDGRSASKRGAKSQNVGEEGGYDSKTQPNTTPTSQHSLFGDNTTYPQRPYTGLDQNAVKRQRVSADFSQGSFDRESWQYSSAPNSAGIYPSSNNSVSAYTPDGSATTHQVSYPYRGHTGDNSLIQASPPTYQRGGLSDYGSGQQHINYENRGGYAHADSSGGIGQYSDGSSYSTVQSNDPSSSLSPTTQPIRGDFSSLSDQSLRQNYRMTLPSSVHGSNVLPLPSNFNTSSYSSSAGNPLSASYNYGNSDGRYSSQTGTPSNLRTGYQQPYSGYSIQAPYPST